MDNVKSFESFLTDALVGTRIRRYVIGNLTYVKKDEIVDHIMLVGKMPSENFQFLMECLDSSRGLCNLGQEKEFMPPDVDFSERGTYYQIVNPPEPEVIQIALDRYGFYEKAYTQRGYPEIYLYDYMVYEFVWKELYGEMPQDTRIMLVKSIVNEKVEFMGWKHQTDRQIFTAWQKWTRMHTYQMDMDFDGETSISVRSFYESVAHDAYSKPYHAMEKNFPQDFQEYVLEMAEHYGYDRKDNRFVPKPVPLPDNIEEIGQAILSNKDNLVFSEHGYQVMPLQTIRTMLQEHDIQLSVLKIKFQLMGSDGTWAKPLVVNGFDLYTEEYWGDHFDFGVSNERFLCVQKQRMKESSLNHTHKASFAPGLPITLVGFILNPHSGELVYINMVGPYNSVRANWSELMQKKQHTYGGVSFKVATASNHKPFRGFLPSGMYQIILINHSASPEELSPLDDKFYLLTNDRSDDMPANFRATLDKFLKVPVMPHWAEYLWVLGRSIGMIKYTGNPNKQVGGTSWTVLRGSDDANWSTLISTAIASKAITL